MAYCTKCGLEGDAFTLVAHCEKTHHWWTDGKRPEGWTPQ